MILAFAKTSIADGHFRGLTENQKLASYTMHILLNKGTKEREKKLAKLVVTNSLAVYQSLVDSITQ